MNFQLQFDASVTNNNPYAAAFENAAQYVANLFNATFTNNVTVTLSVGFGTYGVENTAVPATAVGINQPNGAAFFNYDAVRAALAANGAPSASLPTYDPTNGHGVLVTYPQVKALGLQIDGSFPAVDGVVGISSTASLYYGTSGTPAAGQYDLVSTLEHEISEEMGRLAYATPTPMSVLDLYRYSSQGSLMPQDTLGGYFSINGGQSGLQTFNGDPNGDIADWAYGASPDAFDAFGTTGAAPALSASDLMMMRALGWQTNVVGTGSNLAGNGENDVVTQASNGVLTVRQLNANGSFGASSTAGVNSITLSSANPGATANLNGATVALGNGASATVNGVGDFALIGAGTSASLQGNHVYVAAGISSAATVSGTGNYIDAGAGDGIGIVGGGNTLHAGDYTTAVDYGTNDTVIIGAHSNLTVFGNGESSNVGGASTVAIAGINDNVAVGGGSVVLISGSQDAVNAYGTNNTIAIGTTANHNIITSGDSTLALDLGTYNSIAAGAGSAITNQGSYGTDTAGINSTFSVAGSSNLFKVKPSSAYVMGSAGTDTLTGTIANYAGDLIVGLSSGMHVDITDLIPANLSVNWTGSSAAGVLAFSNGSQSLLVATSGSYNPGALRWDTDGAGGTLLKLS